MFLSKSPKYLHFLYINEFQSRNGSIYCDQCPQKINLSTKLYAHLCLNLLKSSQFLSISESLIYGCLSPLIAMNTSLRKSKIKLKEEESCWAKRDSLLKIVDFLSLIFHLKTYGKEKSKKFWIFKVMLKLEFLSINTKNSSMILVMNSMWALPFKMGLFVCIPTHKFQAFLNHNFSQWKRNWEWFSFTMKNCMKKWILRNTSEMNC